MCERQIALKRALKCESRRQTFGFCGLVLSIQVIHENNKDNPNMLQKIPHVIWEHFCVCVCVCVVDIMLFRIEFEFANIKKSGCHIPPY